MRGWGDIREIAQTSVVPKGGEGGGSCGEPLGVVTSTTGLQITGLNAHVNTTGSVIPAPEFVMTRLRPAARGHTRAPPTCRKRRM